MNYNTVDISPQSLHELHLTPFKAAVDAGALALMTAFNDVPATANPLLLTEILRRQWGFKSFVVSNYTSDFQTIAHGFAENESDAAQFCLSTGASESSR
jgi:beta-glucosidase